MKKPLTQQDELTILNLSRPLDPSMRDAFYSGVSSLLRGRTEIGPGELHRLCADLQRTMLRGQYPSGQLDRPRDKSKPSRRRAARPIAGDRPVPEVGQYE
jgi:hypothetical protein